ncbi:MAG TPA: hypothetical protein VGB30_10925 [bacterium]|jgi:hypothetical protein
MRLFYYTAIVLVLGFVFGCSSGTSPVMPENTPDISSQRTVSGTDNTHLWGLYEIHVDVDAGTIEAVPLRGAMFTANVTGFVDGPPTNLLLDIQNIDVGPDYTDVLVDVGLRHPFAGLDQYTGFDVIGVFMGDGTETHPGPENYPMTGEGGQYLKNPDGYTRWFNATEFAATSLPLLGYNPGKLGTKSYVPSSVLNPYKYFTDGLGAGEDAFEYLKNNTGDRGKFTPGSVNYRTYDIRFPDTSGITFQYAVIASWEPNVNDPNPPNSLDDFPISANAFESRVISVTDNSDLWNTATEFGGNVDLQIELVDWSVGSTWNNDFQVVLWSEIWNGPKVIAAPDTIDEPYVLFKYFDSPELKPMLDDALWAIKVYKVVEYANHDYSNDFGVGNNAMGPLSGYFTIEIPVSNVKPDEPTITVTSPNGGEQWEVGSTREITWTSSDVSGTAFLEYSKDDFGSDINVISTDETDDGSYDWVVPDDISGTVKVRVSSTDDPAVNDVSDDYFEIVPAWIEVTIPNGGETWYYGFTEDIEWASSGGITDVRIDLSTDSGATYPTVITASTTNDGVYEWDIPVMAPATTARIRVQSVAGPAAEDESDADFEIADPPDNYVYGIGDFGFFDYVGQVDNSALYTNMLNLPLTGPNASGTTVQWHHGHADDYNEGSLTEFISLIQNAGYTWDFDGDLPLVVPTTTKMLIISFMFLSATDPAFTSSEIQEIRDCVNNGGIVIILVDNTAVHPSGSTGNIDALLLDLGVDFTFPNDQNISDPYTDITSDPVTTGVTQLNANVGGHWGVAGTAVSLVRDSTYGLTAIVKGPIS